MRGKARAATGRAGKAATRFQVSFVEVLGAVLWHARKRANLNQSAIAEACELSTSQWSRIEAGQTSPTVVQLRCAVRLLDAPAWRYLKDAEEVCASIKSEPRFELVETEVEHPTSLSKSAARMLVIRYYELRSQLER